jgi:hypothetical protein
MAYSFKILEWINNPSQDFLGFQYGKSFYCKKCGKIAYPIVFPEYVHLSLKFIQNRWLKVLRLKIVPLGIKYILTSFPPLSLIQNDQILLKP